MTDWKSRIVGYGKMPADALLANPNNWRIHPAAQMQALEGVLDTIGQVAPLIVNQRSGYVVDGHARAALGIRREQQAVDCAFVDVSDEEERLIIATLDPIGAMAATDDAKYQEVIQDLKVEDERVLALIRQQANDNAWAPTNTEDQPDALTAIPYRFAVHCRLSDKDAMREALEGVVAEFPEAVLA
jgi:hypothetical protein